MERTRDFARSIAAALTGAVVVVVPPWALARLRGWPLPSVLPTFADLRRAFDGASISDSVLLDALAVVLWLLWAALVACLLVELIAWARGRSPRELAGIGPLQMVARRLVVTATMLVGVTRQPAIGAAAPVRVVAVSELPSSPATTPAEVAPRPVCTVGPRDSLWRLAERHLDDPFRWREIFELNRGRSFPDGRTLRDPDVIQPGWTLYLPEDAVGDMPAESIEPVAPPSQPVAAPPPVHTSNAPAVTAPRSATTIDATTKSGPAADEEADGGGFDYAIPAGLAGAGLLAAGVVRLVSDLRRRQRRLREPGRTISLPRGEVLHEERRLREAADFDGAERVDAALRLLSAQLVDLDGARVDAVHVRDAEVTVTFTRAVRAGAGVARSDDGRSWVLDAEADLASCEDVISGSAALAPGLVVAGTVDDTTVLIDLEADEPLAVHGDAAVVDRLLGCIALDLATHGWADDVRIVVTGLEGFGFDGIDRCEIVQSVEDAMRLVDLEASMLEAGIRASGVDSTWEARAAGIGDGWTPIVLVVGSSASARLSDPLASLARRSGVGVVTYAPEDPPIDDARRLVVSPTHVAVMPSALVLNTPVLPKDVEVAAAELVQTAIASEPGPPLEPVTDELIDLRERSRDDGQVLVRILGRVEIEGGRRPLDRRRVIEFATLLALHPRGLTEGQIKAALWTDQEPTANAFNQVVSRARVALGVDVDGNHHVGYVQDCLYKPGPHFRTDWSILEAAWARAAAQSTPDALADLRDALELVRGLPFEGTKGYEWAYEEGLPARIDSIVDEARSMVASAGARAS